MAVRLLFLLFVLVLAAFGYISLLNGQHVQFFLSNTRQVEVTVSELAILSFALGAAMVVLGTMVKDVTQASRIWKDRRETQRREAARARVAKASDLFQRGLLADAARELSRSLSVNPDDREALELLASVETERGNHLEAVKTLTRIKQQDPSDLSVYFRLANLYRAMNDTEAAFSTLKAVENAEGGNLRAWEGLRDLHIHRNEMLPAYEMHKRILKLKGKDAAAEDQALLTALRYEKAKVRLSEGKTDDGERRLRELVKEQQGFVPAYTALSEYLRSRGNLDGAMELLLQGYRATRNPVFLIKIEDLGVETEQPQTIIGIYAELLQEFPGDPDVNLFMGKFFLRLEMNDEAVEQLLKAEMIEPDREELQVLLAEAFRRRGRHESASEHYQRAYGYKRRYLIPFRCNRCGKATIKWTSRCPECGAWDSYSLEHRRRDFSVSASVR